MAALSLFKPMVEFEINFFGCFDNYLSFKAEKPNFLFQYSRKISRIIDRDKKEKRFLEPIVFQNIIDTDPTFLDPIKNNVII